MPKTIEEIKKIPEFLPRMWALREFLRQPKEDNSKYISAKELSQIVQTSDPKPQFFEANEIIKDWYENYPKENPNIDDFALAISLMHPDSKIFDATRNHLILKWVKSHDEIIEYDEFLKLTELLDEHNDVVSNQQIIIEYLDKRKYPITPKQFLYLLTKIDRGAEIDMSKFITIGLESLKYKVDLETLNKIFPTAGYISSQDKMIILWIKNNSDSITLDDLKNISQKIVNPEEKKQAARNWIVSKTNLIDLETLEKTTQLFLDPFIKYVLIVNWIDHPQNNNLAFEDITKLLKIIPEYGGSQQIILNWLSKEKKNLSFLDLKKLFDLSEEQHHPTILLIWLNEKDHNLPLDEFEKIFNQASQSDKAILLAVYLEKEETKDTSWDQIKNMVRTMTKPLPNEILRKVEDGIIEWLLKEEDPEKRYLKLKDVINSELLFDKHTEFREIFILFQNIKLDPERGFGLCKDLYILEFYQISLATEFLKRDFLKINDPGFISLQKFISQIQSSESALEFIDEAKFDLKLSKKDILILCKGRVANQYQLVAPLLASTSLEEGLTEDGLKTLKESLGINDDEARSIKLDAYFSFQEMHGFANDFFTSINPKFLKNLRETFRLPDSIYYLNQAEYGNLKTLLGTKTPKLPLVQEFCGLFKDRIPPFPTYSSEEINNYQIRFPTHNPLTDEQKKSFNEEFKKLFNKQNEEIYQSNDEIAKFMLGIVSSDVGINEENTKQLGTFFRANKNMMAYFLQTQDGLDTISNLLHGVGPDGCVINFATQVRRYALQSIIKDPCDQILYLFFSDKIAYPILNQGGDHLGGDTAGTDIFTNSVITKNLLSPNGLIAGIFQYIKSDNDFAVSVVRSEFMKRGSSREEADDKIDNLFYDLKSLENVNKLATYLIVRDYVRSLEGSIISVEDATKFDKIISPVIPAELSAVLKMKPPIQTIPPSTSPEQPRQSRFTAFITNLLDRS